MAARAAAQKKKEFTLGQMRYSIASPLPPPPPTSRRPPQTLKEGISKCDVHSSCRCRMNCTSGPNIEIGGMSLDVLPVRVRKPNTAACGTHHKCKVFVSAAPPISFNFASFYNARIGERGLLLLRSQSNPVFLFAARALTQRVRD